ncbi:MAG TPA: HWE histidine kinase domain-containing protein [Caulobacteraceae bacterium]|jgi:PAS domain S-box-containing protein
MPDPVETMSVPSGAFRALWWFYENSKDAFLLMRGEAVERINPAWARMTGFGAAQSDHQPVWRFIHPEDVEAVQARYRALTFGARFDCEFRLATSSGAPLWARADFINGAEDWILAIVRDISAERALRESERRFRGLVNATSDVVYRMSPDWREMRALDGRGFIADTETPSIAWIDEYLLPEDHPAILEAIRDAIEREDLFQLEHRVRRVDGSTGWTLSRAMPIRGEGGQIIEWFGTASDVTERRQAEEHLELVAHELSHRVKNNLAMIAAAATQTFRNASDLDDAQETLMARIEALARASDLLTGDAKSGPALRGVVAEAIQPHCGDAARCLVTGPDVDLPVRAAHAFSLAFHELATNAVKHGAWSSETGRVEVAWTAERAPGGQHVRLSWRERGGPPVTPPKRRGFGSRLVERLLAGDLHGKVEYHFERPGFECLVDVPLA